MGPVPFERGSELWEGSRTNPMTLGCGNAGLVGTQGRLSFERGIIHRSNNPEIAEQEPTSGFHYRLPNTQVLNKKLKKCISSL